MAGAVVLVTGIGCGPEPGGDPVSEGIGTASAAVVGGVTDHTDIYPFVGEYVWDVGGSCTGILVTPAWVLTANHCVTEPFVKTTNNLSISFANTGKLALDAGSPTDAIREHTLAVSGEVKVRVGSSIGEWGDDLDDVAKDMALIQLDARVPMATVAPRHVPALGPEPGPTCRSVFGTSTFGATLVGFGGDHGMRTYLYSDGWRRESASGGGVYRNRWLADGGYPGASEPGDSGGALVRDGMLCGVNNGHHYWLDYEWVPVPPYVVPVLYLYTQEAAVDSSQAQKFIKDNIIDVDGRFMGECLPGESPAGLDDVDTDGDLIPDGCDPCPSIADPFYRFTRAFTVLAANDPLAATYPAFIDRDLEHRTG